MIHAPARRESMKEVEKKDKKEDEPEIPDVSGGYVDGCFPTPVEPELPGSNYPQYPGLPDPLIRQIND
jgi:hypothetical protein